MITWIFHSWTRLLLAVFGLAFILAGAGALLGPDHREPLAATPTASARPIAKDEARDFARDAVDRWCDLEPGQTPAQWRTDLTKISTPDYAAGIELTDPSMLTGDCPWGLGHIPTYNGLSAVVSIPTKSGRPVYVTVIRHGTDRLLVADITAADPTTAVGDL